MGIRLTLLYIPVVLATGCMSPDAQTTWLLNERLSKLETGSTGSTGSLRSVPQEVTSPRGWLGSGNFVVIYVRMPSGGYFPVKIVQKNTNVFEGPKGEFYEHVPTPEQLRYEYGH